MERQCIRRDVCCSVASRSFITALIGPISWDWCLAELRSKAIQSKKVNHVLVLDSGSCVSKSDTLITPDLRSALKQGVAPILLPRGIGSQTQATRFSILSTPLCSRWSMEGLGF